MRYYYPILYVLLMLSTSFCRVQAQQFSPITVGDIVTIPADSRSCNFIDINGDAFDDIFITNGPSTGQNNMLFMSNGDGTFTMVTADTIVKDKGRSDGASFADVDNDGDLDAYVVTWYGSQNFFYRNNGDATFSFESNTANPAGTYSETCSWGDFDSDGYVDLYISNSTDFNQNTDEIKRNVMYVSQDGNSFERLTVGGPVEDAKISRSVQWVDYDGDGDLDLFVSNEENQRNQLYKNLGGSKLVSIDNALTRNAKKSTGSSWGDVDNDGDLDVFIANYNQNNELYLNDGQGDFVAVTSGNAVSGGGCSFGSGFADYDNDGDLDLAVANGFCSGVFTNFLYLNDGQGNFTVDRDGITDRTTRCSFGMAWGDLDNDGFQDLVIANCKGSTTDQERSNSLFRNIGNDNHWVKFNLEGSVSNRSAIGAKVRVKATIDGQEVWQMREINAQTGYCGQNSLTVHFGLKDATQIDSLIIEWPRSAPTYHSSMSADQTYDMLETGSVISALEVEIIQDELLVYPNPTSSYIRLKPTRLQASYRPTQLAIYDLQGKQYIEKTVENWQQLDSVSVNQFPVGHYIGKLNLEGNKAYSFSFQVSK